MDQNGKCVILAVRIQQNHVPSEFEISDYYKSIFWVLWSLKWAFYAKWSFCNQVENKF